MSRRQGPGRRWWVWCVPAVAAAGLHYVSYDVTRQPIVTDISFYLYFAQRVAAGDVPYVDFFEHKTPLAIFVGAALYRLGEALGADPLLAIRVGYLCLASLIGGVLFLLYRRLCRDRPGGGWIALLVLCAFPLLGLMPAIGNIPKLLAVLGASGAMLLVGRRHWLWAGVCAGIAALDWQPAGLLAGLGVLVAAGARDGRARAWTLAIFGMVLAWVPAVIYFASRGALGTFLRLTIWTSLSGKAGGGALFSAERIQMAGNYIRADCAGALWLVWAAASVGLPLLIVWIVRRRGAPVLPLLLGLAVYHYGMVLFCLLDFGGHGDMFVLNHSIAFFSALPLVELYYQGLRILSRRRRRARVAGRVARAGVRGGGGVLAWRVAVAVLLLLLIRPSFGAGKRRLAELPWAGSGSTLADQRAAAQSLSGLLGDGRIAGIGRQELLFLGRLTNAVPFVFWNWATESYYRRADEGGVAALTRLLREADPDVVVLPSRMYERGQLRRTLLGLWLEQSYRPLQLLAGGDRYPVIVWARRGGPLPEELPIRLLQVEVFGSPPTGAD